MIIQPYKLEKANVQKENRQMSLQMSPYLGHLVFKQAN